MSLFEPASTKKRSRSFAYYANNAKVLWRHLQKESLEVAALSMARSRSLLQTEQFWLEASHIAHRNGSPKGHLRVEAFQRMVSLTRNQRTIAQESSPFITEFQSFCEFWASSGSCRNCEWPSSTPPWPRRRHNGPFWSSITLMSLLYRII